MMGLPLPTFLSFSGNLVCEFFVTIFDIHVFTQVQTKVEGDYLGRVLSTIFTLAILFMPVAKGLMTWLPSVRVESFLLIGAGVILFSLLAMATITASILFFSNTQTFLIFSSLIGFFSQLKEVPESVFLQETVDENQLVHVYSVFEVISTLAFSVFVFLMSSITESFGITTSFWLSSICILLEAGLIYHNRDYLK